MSKGLLPGIEFALRYSCSANIAGSMVKISMQLERERELIQRALTA